MDWGKCNSRLLLCTSGTEHLLLLPNFYCKIRKKHIIEIQPFFQTYLKEILKEIGMYNNKGPHKSTWEVKPEYRHYQSAEETQVFL